MVTAVSRSQAMTPTTFAFITHNQIKGEIFDKELGIIFQAPAYKAYAKSRGLSGRQLHMCVAPCPCRNGWSYRQKRVGKSYLQLYVLNGTP